MMGQAAGLAIVCEDALTYLPRKPVQEFARGRQIYGPQQPADSLYVVISGRVKVHHTGHEGSQTIVRIVSADSLFGEWVLVGSMARNESAAALDSSALMSWSRREVEQQIEREPRLGLALAQYLVKLCLDLQQRIETMALCKTPERVTRSLLQLAVALGTPMPDEATRVASLTHHTIAEYVGTSREIVTFQMNRLRRLGLIRYSRKHLDIYTRPLQEALHKK